MKLLEKYFFINRDILTYVGTWSLESVELNGNKWLVFPIIVPFKKLKYFSMTKSLPTKRKSIIPSLIKTKKIHITKK